MLVLVPIDGSKLSERALVALAPWLRTSGTEVVLLHVLDPGLAEMTGGTSHRRERDDMVGRLGGGYVVEAQERVVEYHGQALARVQRETEDELRHLAARHLKDVSTDIAAVWATDAAETIVNEAASREVTFIAMGTHGRSGLGHALLGSVASATVRHAAVPVILVGEHVPA